jgi:hypothetical protein
MTRDELLAGSLEEKIRRWGRVDSWRRGYLRTEVLGEPVVFEAVA